MDKELYALLSRALSRPAAIHVYLSETKQVENLKKQLTELRIQYNRLEQLYKYESTINMELADLLREHNIKYRRRGLFTDVATKDKHGDK